MASHSIVRQHARTLVTLFLLSQLLLLAMFVLTSPTARAAATGNTIIVESPVDSGSAYTPNCPGEFCSLRDAVAKAAPGDTVIFDPVVFSVPVTIPLQTKRIQITQKLTIDGSTAPFTPTISGPGSLCAFAHPTSTTCFSVFEVLSGDVTMNRLSIVNGRLASGGGAAIWNAGNLTVTNSAFLNNIAPTDYGYGGALSSSSAGHMKVMSSTFSGNVAKSGGAIYAQDPLTITDSVFTDNIGFSNAGALLGGANMTVMNSIFSRNTVTGTTGGGGALMFSDTTASATIKDSVFSNNSAVRDAGGIYLFSGAMTITNSTLWNNSAGEERYGGAIENMSGSLLLVNSTLANNSAGNGGALQNYGVATIKNTVIAKGALGANCLGNQLAAGSTNNLNDDTSCGSSFGHVTSLLLGTLGNYGGSSHTVPLLPNSPAIDAADGTACPATDQRGIARSFAACDIGVYESQGFIMQSLTGTPQSASTNTAFAAPLGLTVVPIAAVEPVDGGQVVFSAPGGSGVPSLNPAVMTATISSGHVSQPVTANGVAGGPYNVVASARGSANAFFVLTNGGKAFLPFVKR